MTSPPPHFLGLSRELRDMIYTHFTQEINLIWKRWNPPSEPGCWEIFYIKIADAPILNMLLIHPHVYTEYLAACFNAVRINLTLTFEHASWDTGNNSPHVLHRLSGRRASASVPTSIFTHFRTVMLVPPRGRGREQINNAQRTWQDTSNCATQLVSLAANLVAIRVMSETTGVVGLPFDELAQWVHENRATTRRDFLIPPPEALAGFPLLQRCEGFFAKTEKGGKPCRLSHAMLGPHWPILSDPYRAAELYTTRKMGVYLFARNTQPQSKHFWRADEVISERLKGRRDRREGLGKLYRGEPPLLEDPDRLQEWKEERGAKLEAWIAGEGVGRMSED